MVQKSKNSIRTKEVFVVIIHSCVSIQCIFYVIMRIITKLGTGCKAKFEQDMALFIVNKFPETLYNSRDQPGSNFAVSPKNI